MSSAYSSPSASASVMPMARRSGTLTSGMPSTVLAFLSLLQVDLAVSRSHSLRVCSSILTTCSGLTDTNTLWSSVVYVLTLPTAATKQGASRSAMAAEASGWYLPTFTK